jgi:hypothetical protein
MPWTHVDALKQLKVENSAQATLGLSPRTPRIASLGRYRTGLK